MDNTNGIKKGDIVTWGGGRLRGEVVAFILFNGTSLEARVRLVAAAPAPCGREFPIGSEGNFPVADLRVVTS